MEGRLDQMRKLEEAVINDEKDLRKSLNPGKLTKYRHTGFGFDGEAGHDQLVTGNLMKRFRKALVSQMDDIENLQSLWAPIVKDAILINDPESKSKPVNFSASQSNLTSRIVSEYDGSSLRDTSNEAPLISKSLGQNASSRK